MKSLLLLHQWFEYARSALYREIRDIYLGLPRHPRWFIMRKLARFDGMRTLVNNLRSRPIPLAVDPNLLQPEHTVFPGVDIDNLIDCLKKDGLYLGLNLPENLVQQIIQFTKETPCYGNRKAHLGFYYHEMATVLKTANKEFAIADYFNTHECEAIQKIVKDPVLLQIAGKYLEGPPVHQGTRLRWSFRSNSSDFEKFQYSQTFHYDVDDYSAMKVLFYLTDVTSDGGPHVCIVGSHRSKTFACKILRGNYNESLLLNSYKSENVKHIYGNSGYGFVEDAAIMHKGLRPINADRLILIIEFALRDYEMQHDRVDKTQLKQISIS